MSYDLGIHVWYDEAPSDTPYLFAQIAATLPSTKTRSRLVVTDRGPSEVVLSVDVEDDDDDAVRRTLSSFVGRQFGYQLDRSFEVVADFESKNSIVNIPRPMTIQLFGDRYGVGGYYNKRNGLVLISFSNVKAFSVSPSLIQRAQAMQRGSDAQVQILRAIGAISHNIDLIHNMAAEIILQTHPTHLMVCTEWEVHPLTAHAIYHRDVSEFPRDIDRIRQLHDAGGLYLQDPEESRVYADPRCQSRDYGYLRDKSLSKEFALRIDSLPVLVAQTGKTEGVSNREILEMLQTTPSVYTRELNGGLYVATK